MKTLVIATRNRHKVEEIRAILGDQFRYVTLNDFPGAPKVVEDAPSFAGNAAKKATELARWLGGRGRTMEGGGSRMEDRGQRTEGGRQGPRSEEDAGEEVFVLADDSGLEVAALAGAPGVHSARFAALDGGGSDNSSSADNNAKLLRLLEGVPLAKRTARFRCVLALTPALPRQAENASPVCQANESELLTELFEGVCEGRIAFGLRGGRGFGYDPLFVPTGCDQTFGELGEDVKNQMSHRARALAKLKQRFEESESGWQVS